MKCNILCNIGSSVFYKFCLKKKTINVDGLILIIKMFNLP